ncbi:SsgA family sporulation/cell division regulator [Streptomyces rubellomurinus]|uniref:Sporulation protein SsgA n=2 Tax=Streptomyces TaxID=1883 RepID=A0A0F2THC7_STRR3|nr:SsgA family sporulation/cell division regulator [Streptomyces rubellomurinus]KJS56986.1 hypothetical protein VM98_03525 [Streptomyces rubellomurinus subsp. indigoferus]KJS62633.1 hypothetical protein VM95_07505 [Streptomyces rubellomurinus]
MHALTTPITMRLITGERHTRDLDVAWSYRPDDPCVISLDFRGSGSDAVWELSRDLLAAGVRTPAGEGDVHVSPFDGTRTLIALGGVEGVALLAVRTEELDRFLAATDELVPAGSEHSRIDWDHDLARLLAG